MPCICGLTSVLCDHLNKPFYLFWIYLLWRYNVFGYYLLETRRNDLPAGKWRTSLRTEKRWKTDCLFSSTCITDGLSVHHDGAKLPQGTKLESLNRYMCCCCSSHFLWSPLLRNQWRLLLSLRMLSPITSRLRAKPPVRPFILQLSDRGRKKERKN